MKSSLLKIAHLYTYVGYHGIAGHCQLLTYIFYAGRYTMIPAEMHPLLPVAAVPGAPVEDVVAVQKSDVVPHWP